jgi:hypothetical protein
MMLLTKQNRKDLPPLYTNENKKPEEVPVIVKFFCPWSDWTWYATEFDGEDIFFGLVRGHEVELGYFSLSELESLGHKVERDRYFGKHTLAEVMRARL